MTDSEARQLVAALMAAFPQQKVEQPTFDLYAAELSKLQSLDAATEAVQSVIKSSEWFPPLATILAVYRPLANRRKEKELAESQRRELPPGQPQGLPQEVRDLMARWGGLPSDEDWPEGEEGRCRDCSREARLVEYGSLWVCRPCARKRTRVKRRVAVGAGLDVSERYFEPKEEDAA